MSNSSPHFWDLSEPTSGSANTQKSVNHAKPICSASDNVALVACSSGPASSTWQAMTTTTAPWYPYTLLPSPGSLLGGKRVILPWLRLLRPFQPARWRGDWCPQPRRAGTSRRDIARGPSRSPSPMRDQTERWYSSLIGHCRTGPGPYPSSPRSAALELPALVDLRSHQLGVPSLVSRWVPERPPSSSERPDASSASCRRRPRCWPARSASWSGTTACVTE